MSACAAHVKKPLNKFRYFKQRGLNLTQTIPLTKGPEKRYAKALVELILEQKQEDKMYADITSLRVALADVKVLEAFVLSPFVTSEQKTEAILKAVNALKMSGLMVKFITTVGKNKRLAFLDGMLWHAQTLLDGHANRVHVMVESAVKLTDSQKKDIFAFVKKHEPNAKNIIVDETVSEDLIAGVKVQIGSIQVDATLRGTLNNLKTQLTQN